MPRFSLVSFTICATLTGVAAADPVADLVSTLATYQARTEHLAYYLSEGIDPARFPIRGCHTALERGRAAGIEVTTANVAVCNAFVARHQLAEADAALTTAHDWFFYNDQIGYESNNEDNGPTMVKDAARCKSEMSRLLAAGMPTNVEITIGKADPLTLTMSDANTKVCQRLAKIASTFSRDVRQAKAQRIAEIAGPYKAAGITGDRLDFLVDHTSYAMYGVGGVELETPKQLKRANVIFELLGPASGRYTLRRYQFRGDKLVATTTGEYWLRPASKEFR
jgi:hypothetical protein